MGEPQAGAQVIASNGAQISSESHHEESDLSLRPNFPAKCYRHEWYQSATHVVVTVFAKGVSSDRLHVEFGEQTLSVVIQPSEGEEFSAYALQLQLFGKIDPSPSKHSLMGTKVEVRLAKSEKIHWTGLEIASRTGKVDQPINVSDERAAAVKHEYPSSSRKAKAINWDKVEAEAKEEEKGEKLEGDAALNKLFQDIYRNADEETRRAMNKSFVESSGTVLSTNWKEVGTKTIEPKK